MDIRTILADNIRTYRKAAGLTQMELAEKADLHRAYVGRIEQQRINTSIEIIEKLAIALDVEPYQLLLPKINE